MESWIHFHVSPQYGGFRAHLCLEADYILEKMEPVTLDEGETDVAWWNRGVVQPGRRDAHHELSEMLRPKSKQRAGS